MARRVQFLQVREDKKAEYLGVWFNHGEILAAGYVAFLAVTAANLPSVSR